MSVKMLAKNKFNVPIVVGGSMPTVVPRVMIENPNIDYLFELIVMDVDNNLSFLLDNLGKFIVLGAQLQILPIGKIAVSKK